MRLFAPYAHVLFIPNMILWVRTTLSTAPTATTPTPNVAVAPNLEWR
ncbi:MAG TPA: hypothetical protein PK735_14300 [Flavobacteriales bacterium]|nr:hypothetical protein [Flavobacteriales bacterium]